MAVSYCFRISHMHYTPWSRLPRRSSWLQRKRAEGKENLSANHRSGWQTGEKRQLTVPALGRAKSGRESKAPILMLDGRGFAPPSTIGTGSVGLFVGCRNRQDWYRPPAGVRSCICVCWSEVVVECSFRLRAEVVVAGCCWGWSASHGAGTATLLRRRKSAT